MVDKIVTLDNDQKYLILDKVIVDNKKYYLGIKLENNEPSSKYLYFEEINDNSEISLKSIVNDKTKAMLLTSFTIDYMNMVYDGSEV